MRVAIVSTYRPRPCGIAVFSADLRAALLEGDSPSTVEIVRDEPHAHPPEVVATIRQDVASDYAAAPSELRRRSVDVVLVEHEYGIFGGDVGSYILKLTNELSMPMVVTLHTVLANPPDRAEVRRTLCEHAVLVMVFTETARRRVIEQGLAESEQVRLIPHGAPDELTQAAWSDRVGKDLNFRPLQSSSVSMWGSTAEYPPPVGNMTTSSSSLQLGQPSPRDRAQGGDDGEAQAVTGEASCHLAVSLLLANIGSDFCGIFQLIRQWLPVGRWSAVSAGRPYPRHHESGQ